MEDTSLNAVVKNTFSIEDVYARIQVMQQFFEHVFFQSTGQVGERTDLLRNYFQESDAETRDQANAVAAWGSDELAAYTASNLYERIGGLKTALETLPKLILYVPVHLSLADRERIGTWCRANIQQNIILDLHVDPSTVGGCVLVHNGILHDFSLTHFAKKQKAELVNLVHTYG